MQRHRKFCSPIAAIPIKYICWHGLPMVHLSPPAAWMRPSSYGTPPLVKPPLHTVVTHYKPLRSLGLLMVGISPPPVVYLLKKCKSGILPPATLPCTIPLLPLIPSRYTLSPGHLMANISPRPVMTPLSRSGMLSQATAFSPIAATLSAYKL